MGAPQEEAVVKPRTKITVQAETDIPSFWPRFIVRKKTSVGIRASKGVEEFKVSWQDAILKSDPAVDLIVIPPDGKEYPCKKDIFFSTYQPLPAVTTEDVIAGYKFVKSATTKLAAIPEGIDVTIKTLEGVLPIVTHPDYIAIGSVGELYANTKDFVDQNMEIIS